MNNETDDKKSFDTASLVRDNIYSHQKIESNATLSPPPYIEKENFQNILNTSKENTTNKIEKKKEVKSDSFSFQPPKQPSGIKRTVKFSDFSDGIGKNNPIFVLLLGMCPTLAVTTKVANGLGMGIAATFVLIFSNMIISSLKNFIPDKVRIPAYIVIIASFVTIIELLMQAFLPSLTHALGVFLPLIVVNCIILGRAEAFASKNSVLSSLLDGLGTGLGFTLSLVLIGFIREFFGTLKIDFTDFGLGTFTFLKNPDSAMFTIGDVQLYEGAKIFTMPAGAFFILGILLALKQGISDKLSRKTKTEV